MSNEKYEECKGCGIARQCIVIPEDIKWPDKKIKCPCVICLIKMICVKGCAPYRKYSNHVLKKAEVKIYRTIKE